MTVKVNVMLQKIYRNSVILLGAVLVLVSLACSTKNNNPTEPEAPTDPVELMTQTFKGSLPEREERCHFFTVTADGAITTEITDLKPLVSLTVGLSLGTPADVDQSICSDIGEDRSARVNETFLSANNLAGEYCTCIFDVGNIFPGETIDYVIDVTHP